MPAPKAGTPAGEKPVPAKALRHAHILQRPSCGHGFECIDTVFEGDGPGWSGGWVSIPSSEPGDDPGGPSEAVWRVRIALEARPAGIGLVHAVKNGFFLGVEHD